MKAVAVKQTTNQHPIKGRMKNNHTPLFIRTSVAPNRKLVSNIIQRKPNCACGGGCPKCLESLGIQAKLRIGAPNDVYEQEADRVAEQVMRMSTNETLHQPKPMTGLIGRSVQRKCSRCEEDEKKKPIMRKAESGNSGMQVPSSFGSSLNASKGSGSTLPKGTKKFMENAFSTDLSQVRIHSGREATQMSKGINAKAFTCGSDIYFNEGQYNPESNMGKNLLANELTHVVQQSHSRDALE